MSDRYILDDKKNPVLEPDITKWAQWYNDVDGRRVKQTTLTEGVSLSTVFLGLDHNFSFADDSRPILFETMIFGGEYDQKLQWRYRTWQEALINHERIVALYYKGGDLGAYEGI